MKKKITVASTKEVEINLPYYCTDGICHWYKIFNEDFSISVYNSKHSEQCRLQILNSSVPLIQEKLIECSEKEFIENYITVIRNIDENI